MTSFSFVHAADLHLDSPFQGVTAQSPRVAKKLRDATFEAFENIINLCLERRVDFLVVAGDVYDGVDRSLRAQLRFRDGLARLATQGIRSFVVHGNHDPLDGWSSAIDWPQGVHVFGDRVGSLAVERSGAAIALVSGISYPRRKETRNLAKLYTKVSKEVAVSDSSFRVGVLHANVGNNRDHDPYAPCEIVDLLEAGVDYWALGHIHAHGTLHAEPHVVYSGNSQGRSMRELGPRGCVFVQVFDGRRISMEFIPVDVVRWQRTQIEIDGLSTIDGLDAALVNCVDELRDEAEGRPLVCRIQLTGRGPLYRELRREAHLSELVERVRERHVAEEPFVWIEQIEFACRPEVDIEQRRRSPDLVGEVLRAAEELRGGPLREVLRPALQDLYENRRVQKALATAPDEQELAVLLAEAELLCVDRLDPSD